MNHNNDLGVPRTRKKNQVIAIFFSTTKYIKSNAEINNLIIV